MSKQVMQMTPANIAKSKDGTKTETRRTNLRWLKVRKGDTIRFAPGRGKKCDPQLYVATKDARKEPLNVITAEGAMAEGCTDNGIGYPCIASALVLLDNFERLWDSIKRKPGKRYADNPDVVVVSYRRLGQ